MPGGSKQGWVAQCGRAAHAPKIGPRPEEVGAALAKIAICMMALTLCACSTRDEPDSTHPRPQEALQRSAAELLESDIEDCAQALAGPVGALASGQMTTRYVIRLFRKDSGLPRIIFKAFGLLGSDRRVGADEERIQDAMNFLSKRCEKDDIRKSLYDWADKVWVQGQL